MKLLDDQLPGEALVILVGLFRRGIGNTGDVAVKVVRVGRAAHGQIDAALRPGSCPGGVSVGDPADPGKIPIQLQVDVQIHGGQEPAFQRMPVQIHQ